MENILLVINIILALILVSLILLQKSEGGALGIGVSQENFMLSRSAGGFMTKATAVVATLFIICHKEICGGPTTKFIPGPPILLLPSVFLLLSTGSIQTLSGYF